MLDTTVTPDRAVATYRALLSVPHVRRMLVGWSLGRLPGGLIALGFGLATLQAGGNLALCGLVAAAFSLAYAVTAPVLGRLIDRRGQVVLLRPCVLVHASALAAAAVAAGAGHHWLLVPLAALAGATVPPLVACQRSLWPVVLPQDLQGRAAAFEAMAINGFYVVGPAVAGLLALAGRAELALACAAALATVGVWVFSTAAPVRDARPGPDAPPRPRHWLGPLRQPAVVPMLLAGVGFSAAVSAMDLSALAWGRRIGVPAAGGWLVAGFAAVGALAAAWYGRGPGRAARPRRREGYTETRWWLLTLAGGCGLAAVVSAAHAPAAAFAVVLLATQVAVSPLLVTLVVLAGHQVDACLRTELHTWRASANQLGWALGALLAGVAATVTGTSIPAADPASGGASAPWPAVACAALLSLAAAGCTVLGSRLDRRPSPAAAPQPAVPVPGSPTPRARGARWPLHRRVREGVNP